MKESQSPRAPVQPSFVLTVEDLWAGVRGDAISKAWLPSDQGALIEGLAQCSIVWRERGPDMLRAHANSGLAERLEAYFSKNPLNGSPWPLSRQNWGGIELSSCAGSIAECERGLALLALGRCGMEAQAAGTPPSSRGGRCPIAISERGLIIAVRCLKSPEQDLETYLGFMCAALAQEREKLVPLEDFAQDPTSFVSNNANAWRARALARDEQFRIEASLGPSAPRAGQARRGL